MAMAWIEQISNSSNVSIRIVQTDPTYNPVVNGTPYESGAAFEVAAGQSINLSRCVVAWEGYGDLRIHAPNGLSIWKVGPRRNDQDYLYGVTESGATVNEILLGKRGNQFICSKRYRLVVETSGPRFEYIGDGMEAVVFGPILRALGF